MTVDSTGMAPAPQAPEPSSETRNGLHRLAGALFAPVETFRDIARRPDVLTPVIVILLISVLGSIIMAPRVDFESAMRDQMSQANPNMSQADLDRMVRFGSAFTKVMLYAAPLLNLIFVAIVAGVLLLAFRLFGGDGGYHQAFSVTLYAWMPLIVQGITGTIILLLRGEASADELATLVMSSPAFLVDMKANPVVFSLLSSFDVFTFWSLALFTIGFSFVSRMSRGTSAVIVFSLWAAMVAVKVGFAALGAARAATA